MTVADRNLYWPSWYKGKELSVQDLTGLEQYLLSQRSLESNRGLDHGVVSLDPSRDISIILQGDSANFSVAKAKGFTPEGDPVIVAGDISHQLAVESDSSPILLDAWIVLDNTLGINDKRSVIAEQVFDSEQRLPDLHSNRLYIGRYRAGADQVELCNRPWVYSLSAIDSSNTDKWLKPLSSQITKLLSQIETCDKTDPLKIALCTKIVDIAHDWLTIPISTLIRQLKLISLLMKEHSHGRISLSSFQTGSELHTSSSSENLPYELANLLIITHEQSKKKPLIEGDEFVSTWQNNRLTVDFQESYQSIQFLLPQTCIQDSNSSIMLEYGQTLEARNLDSLQGSCFDLHVKLGSAQSLSLWPLKKDNQKFEIWKK